MKLRVSILAGLVFFVAASAGQAQQTPVVPDNVWDALANEISGDIAFDHLRQLTLYHSPNGGTDDFRREAEWVAQKARTFGLADVRIIWLKADSPGWNLRAGEAWVVSPKEVKLGDVRETPLRVAVASRAVDATAELVHVAAGTSEADFEGKEVKGKIVLASGSLDKVQEEAVWKRGALGIMSYGGRRREMQDQLPWFRLPRESEDKQQQSAFAWVLTPREGERVKELLEEAEEAVQVRVKIEAEFGEKIQGIVEGWIRGTEIPDQQVVLTSHLQEERTSANDDRSGVASMLEIARALVRLIDEGKLRRPRRDIRFWWVNEISAPYQYFADHPEEAGRMLVNLNQDMVGAKQSAAQRVQFLSRTPFSRPSFLNDVMESVLEAVRAGNTAWPLTAGTDRGLFSRPLLSTLGTREPYRAAAVPFYDSTDHLTFNDGRVGVPGISLTNWPDPYIHSYDDDLWQIDATQLKRNAFVIAASAHFIASAGEEDVPAIAALLLGGAQKRLARDVATALALATEGNEGYQDADLLLEAAVARELGAVDSASVF
ncbi:MAG: M28 family peptidase, partial [Terriglobia bacterium]